MAPAIVGGAGSPASRAGPQAEAAATAQR